MGRDGPYTPGVVAGESGRRVTRDREAVRRRREGEGPRRGVEEGGGNDRRSPARWGACGRPPDLTVSGGRDEDRYPPPVRPGVAEGGAPHSEGPQPDRGTLGEEGRPALVGGRGGPSPENGVIISPILDL